MIYDLIIVGGSIAATSAGIYASRRKLNFKIVTIDLGGEVATSGIIENWPGIIKTDGITLSQQFKDHLKSYNAPIDEGIEVNEIKKDGDIFLIKTANKTEYKAKSVIVATGVRPRKLNVPGEEEFFHKGLSYCTVCDGPLFQQKVTGVIGGGNSALESALMLADIAKQVFIINKNPVFKGEEILIEKVKNNPKIEIIYNADTKKILGTNFISGIVYQDLNTKQEKTLALEGVFIHIGMVPNSYMLNDVEKNQFGEIIVTKKCETSIPGLFAAGDVTDVPYKQIVISAGQGAIAALAAVEFLNKIK